MKTKKNTNVSVIITLFDPGDFLEQQIVALKEQDIPSGFQWEVLYVDNTLSGRHKETVINASSDQCAIRYLHEPTPGKCSAVNRGIIAAQGDVLLFTDDDVLPKSSWVKSMSAPILNGEAEVVVGDIEIHDELKRPWMGLIHKTIFMDRLGRDILLDGIHGANAAVKKEFLLSVGGLDPELGPGRLGAGEDSLLGLQLKRLGCRFLLAGEQATVLHCFNKERLKRNSFIQYAKAAARSDAYIRYHWNHEDEKFPWIKALKSYIGLCWVRAKMHKFIVADGILPHEHYQISRIWYFLQFGKEKRRMRNYADQSCRKVGGDLSIIGS